MPRVTVSFPVYNSMPYLRLALDSILAQTFTDWELVAIDDGSIDASYETLMEYAAADPRIRVYQNKCNRGLAFTRNRIATLADESSEFIALMDADDEAVPERLETQIRYLDDHPEIAALGSSITIIDESSRAVLKRDYPSSTRAIRRGCLCANPCANPSMVFRKSLVLSVGQYDASCVGCEDYDFLLRILEHENVANCPQYLVRYRISAGQWKQAHLKESLEATLRTQRKYLFGHGLFSLKALILHLVKYPLLILPNAAIMAMFKKYAYRKL